jgi:hypothetical protein
LGLLNLSQAFFEPPDVSGDSSLSLSYKVLHKLKQIWLQLQVVGFDAVGSEVVAGLFEEQPKRIMFADEHELEELGAGVIIGARGVLG